ncbi:MAG: aspartate/glutamate racemase family protein [Peptococcaceae bacterium]|jgi:Asp/Glu/hydantoin racemase|nr:aspartate/glutamate racemase family protein [Peptococcaceae bacterium]
MRVLFVNIPTGQETGEFAGFAKGVYVPLLKRNLDLVRQPDTEIVFRFCEWGMGPVDMAFIRYLDHLASRMIYHAAAQAKEEGFDVVVINCVGDPMLWEVRQALDIPVVSIGESALLFAHLMGYRFGLVHISPYNIPETEEKIAKYGLKERCVGLRAIANWDCGQEDGLSDAHASINAFIQTSRELIAAGAEVIIPGCSLLSPAIRLAPGAERDYPNGLTEVDGAAVVDILAVTIKMAESLAAIRQGGSAWISRKGLFVQPTPQVLALARHLTDDSALKFWDVS